MTLLYIQPIAYEAQRLPEIGERIVAAFPSLLESYVLRPNMIISEDEKKIILRRDKRNTPSLNIDATGLLEFLAFGEVPCLGITSFFCREEESRFWGKSSFNQRTAYLATAEPEFEERDTDVHVERVVIEALHELGHVFGLDHHEGLEVTASQKYCPMTTVHEAVAREGIITWGEYISLRDSTSFCDDCTEELTAERGEQKLREAHRRLFQRLF